MTLPIPPELMQQLSTLSPTQLAWLSGYSWAQSQGEAISTILDDSKVIKQPEISVRKVTILSASQTGNARKVAEQLLVKLQSACVEATLVSTGDYKSKQISKEDIVLLVTSTQGEGEPPEEALPLYDFLFSKKAPDLSQLHFAVLALGDSSYPDFCQSGHHFDEQFAQLGAIRLHERVDCDVNYQDAASLWQDEIVDIICKLMPSAADTTISTKTNTVNTTVYQTFTRENPYSATLSKRQKITARDAAKDVEHIEIDLTGSGIRYTVGDALGVYYQNSPDLVAKILHHTQVDAKALVQLADGHTVSIETALSDHLDITQNTPALIQAYAKLSGAEQLCIIAADKNATQNYLASTPPVGMLAAYPQALDAQTLHDLWRPLIARLYSIASSQDEVGEEVHLTVGVVRFEYHNQTYTGGASGFLGERLAEGAPVRIFVEENNRFRLPKDGTVPIIMIGAGTGIAPFRAFMQQREVNGDTGENWLFFGNQKMTDDFLYQAEWLRYRKNGLLNQYDLAWSRQGSNKVYIQHKLQARAADVWAWLERGAHIYVCGDAGKMARDVEQALLSIIIEQSGKDEEEAKEYLNELRTEQRYQRDVY